MHFSDNAMFHAKYAENLCTYTHTSEHSFVRSERAARGIGVPKFFLSRLLRGLTSESNGFTKAAPDSIERFNRIHATFQALT